MNQLMESDQQVTMTSLDFMGNVINPARVAHE